MTTWAEICADAMVLIDDVRLREQIATSPALFYRRMALFVKMALPMLNRPPELQRYLEKSMTEPTFGEFEWVSDEESTQGEVKVETGLTGYDLCSCIRVEALKDGRVVQTPTPVTYDPETGKVTFPQQKEAGLAYELDFYTDGSFADLSPTQRRLFALAVHVVWEERFYADWLNRQPKINDNSFSTVNEANYTEKTSQALLRVRQSFTDELQKYEQDCAYAATVDRMAKRTVLI